MSNDSEHSAELGLGNIAQNVIGIDPPQHPQLDAQMDEQLQRQQQQWAAEHQGETTEESDTMMNATDDNSPVQSDHETDTRTDPTPTEAESTRYNMRSSTRSRSTRHVATAAGNGGSADAEKDAHDENDFDSDGHTGDEDDELAAPTKAHETESVDVARALANVYRKTWKTKNQVLNYRDQLVTEIGHYVNMMERLMDIYESPEPFRPDENSDPTAVYMNARKALRRIQEQRTELQMCHQHIEDTKQVWFHWISHIPGNFKPEEIEVREKFIAVEGTHMLAGAWRHYTSHRRRLNDEEEEVKTSMEWAEKEAANRRQIRDPRAAQTNPNAHSKLPTDTRLFRAPAASGTLFGTTTQSSSQSMAHATTPIDTVTMTTTSATAATWSATNVLTHGTAPTTSTSSAPSTRTPATGTSNPGGFNILSTEEYQAQRAALGLKAMASVNALRPRPTDAFTFGTGQPLTMPIDPSTSKPREPLQPPRQEHGSTTLLRTTETARPEKSNQQLRFAAQNEVIMVTPNKNADTRTAQNRARSASPHQTTISARPPIPLVVPSDKSANAVHGKAPTELSTVMDTLKLVISRLTNIEDQLKAPPQPTAATSNPTNSGEKLAVTAEGRTINIAHTTVTNTNTDTLTPMFRDRANGDYVIPLPPPQSTTDAHTKPKSATPEDRLMAAYGMAAKTGADFGDGIRVSAMDGRTPHLNPEIASSSPVGPKPPTYQRTPAPGSSFLTGAATHTPTAPVMQSSVRAPEPRPLFGDFFDWPRFASEWTYFVNSTMPDQYALMTLLKKLLKGSAQTTAQRYDGYTSEEYDDLWQALSSRFNKPDQVVQHYLGIFKEIQAPTRDTIPELRQFHGDTCVAINKLKRANRDVNNEMFTHTLYSKIQTPKLMAHLHQRKQEITRSGADWHTTAILDAMEQFIQEMEELEAHAKQFANPRNRSFRPQRTFHLQDGKKIRIRCEEDEVEWVDDDEQEETPTPKPTRSRNRSPQKQNVHVTFGEHQKKQFGKRSTPANFAPMERAKLRKQKIGADGRRKQGRCLFCDSIKHRALDCTKYKTHSSRTKRLETINRCAYCTHIGHSQDACFLYKRHLVLTDEAQKIKCDFCTDLHNWIVCPQKFPDKKEERSKSPPPPVTPQAQKSTHKARKETLNDEKEDSHLPTSDEEDFDIEDTFTDCGTNDDSTDEDEEPQRRQHNFNAVARRHPTESVSTQTLLMTTHIPVINTAAHKVEEAVPVFFDQGSDQTYITQSLAERLGLTIKRRFLSTIHTFMDREPDGRQVEVWEVEFDLRLLDGSTIHIVADAVEDFAAPMPTIHGRTKAVAHIIANPELPVPVICETPQILIGTDFLNEFNVIRRRKPLSNGFYVYDSLVGPLLNGKGAATEKIKGPQVHKIHKVYQAQKRLMELTASAETPTDSQRSDEPTNKTLLEALNSLSSLEALGIQSSEATDDSAEVLAKHRETLRRNPDGRYETGLPWLSFVNEMLTSSRKTAKILPTNYKPALARLNSIFRQHSGNPQVMDTYHGTISEYVDRGIVEVVSGTDEEGRIVHYLPHHPVFRADKPTKLRIVFDGSCRCTRHDRSINDCLHCGPNLLESITGILLPTATTHWRH